MSACWIELTEGKQFSRLLYPNPVAFLGTLDYGDGGDEDTDDRPSTSKPNALSIAKTTYSPLLPPIRNVMVLSWLTAINNKGGFLFSINKRRHSASLLLRNSSEHKQFSLSIPVQGMEELVLAVGSVSGRWGRSKFPACHPRNNQQLNNTASVAAATDDKTGQGSLKRQQSKRQQPSFPDGIPGLRAVAMGNSPSTSVNDSSSDERTGLFAIDGTVAHLECITRQVIDQDIDDDHYVIVAQVQRAFVQPSYWNSDMNLFQLQDASIPPYLTFLGSQTFGHVLCVLPLEKTC
jgi:flavin reductase (DIM6/NTAB) family NADH-FMN oxidoreductase RutF